MAGVATATDKRVSRMAVDFIEIASMAVESITDTRPHDGSP